MGEDLDGLAASYRRYATSGSSVRGWYELEPGEREHYRNVVLAMGTDRLRKLVVGMDDMCQKQASRLSAAEAQGEAMRGALAGLLTAVTEPVADAGESMEHAIDIARRALEGAKK